MKLFNIGEPKSLVWCWIDTNTKWTCCMKLTKERLIKLNMIKHVPIDQCFYDPNNKTLYLITTLKNLIKTESKYNFDLHFSYKSQSFLYIGPSEESDFVKDVISIPGREYKNGLDTSNMINITIDQPSVLTLDDMVKMFTIDDN